MKKLRCKISLKWNTFWTPKSFHIIKKLHLNCAASYSTKAYVTCNSLIKRVLLTCQGDISSCSNIFLKTRTTVILQFLKISKKYFYQFFAFVRSLYSIFPVFWYHAIERPSGILPSLHRYLSEKAFGKYLRRLVSTICLLGSVQCQQMEDSTFYGWVLWGLWNIYGQPSCKEGWCFCQSMQIYLDNIQKAKKESAFKSAKNILMLGKAVILV